MYPLNVALPAPAIGFAVANGAAEHEALSALGYLPAIVMHASTAAPGRAELIRQAAAAGVKVDGRWSDARLAEEIAMAATVP